MMGTVYRKQFTKPLPLGARLSRLTASAVARWKDRRGKTRKEALVDGRDDRITVTAKTYTACYRDGGGIVREAKTGCRDKTAAQKVLSDLETRRKRQVWHSLGWRRRGD